MPDTNTPASAGTGEDTSAPATAMDELADILDDPETDTPETPAAKTAGPKTKPEDRDAVFDDGEDDGPDDDATDETSDDESKAGPRDESGKFVSPKSKVKLPDGTTTTIAELTSGHLRQSDYTRKTQELSEQRKQFDGERQRVQQVDQQLQAHYERVNQWLAATRPQKPPGSFSDDPLAHGQYRDEMDRWTEAQTYFGNEQKQVAETRTAEQRANKEKYLRAEAEALFKVVPALKEADKRTAFVKEAARAMADYGISENEIRQLEDHRLILVLRDAVRYRRLQSKTATVKDDLAAKPAVIRGSKRATPATADAADRKKRTDRLNETGSLQDGIAALGSLLD